MSSKEALEESRCVLASNQVTKRYSDIFEENLLRPIEKDLDLFEEYRKAEEEIGVDFITLVKMLKDDIYINDGGIVDEIENIYKEQVKSIEHWPVWGFTAGDDDEMKTLCAFKDRGKTWALDKEEFYEKLSKQKN